MCDHGFARIHGETGGSLTFVELLRAHPVTLPPFFKALVGQKCQAFAQGVHLNMRSSEVILRNIIKSLIS